LAATENYIAGRQPVYELEFQLCHKNGSYRWIHSRGGLLRDQNNQPYRMLCINLDITDYKNTKKLNERRDQMEQTFRYYVASQTAAAIAHELNQPLTAIYSYADVAHQLLQNGNPNPQKLSHILENCAQQALRAGEVIRQLLELLHKGETPSEPIDINTSVYEALDFIKADGYLKAYNIELDLAADLPLVLSNHLHFQKVMVNLLRNGLESMQESGMTAGSITITTRRFTANPAMVEVIVRDYGKGVPDTAELKKMFQHFYTTKPTGLGMGLAISRTLIETHGGKMWAEQNADNGLSLHFTLPIVL
jgi:signal transduction histidine kinase